MIRNLLAAIGFLCVAMAGTAAVYATRWYGDDRAPRMAVSVRGLDLTLAEDRALLDRRVDAAVDRVCAPDSSNFTYGGFGFDQRDCRRKARLGAEPQIRRAIDRAYDRRGYAYGNEPIAPEGYDPAPVAYDPAPVAPAPTYVQPLRPTYVEPVTATAVLRERHTTIVRKPLASRVKWVKTPHGVVKKVTRRKLVRKTVKEVYTR